MDILLSSKVADPHGKKNRKIVESFRIFTSMAVNICQSFKKINSPEGVVPAKYQEQLLKIILYLFQLWFLKKSMSTSGFSALTFEDFRQDNLYEYLVDLLDLPFGSIDTPKKKKNLVKRTKRKIQKSGASSHVPELDDDDYVNVVKSDSTTLDNDLMALLQGLNLDTCLQLTTLGWQNVTSSLQSHIVNQNKLNQQNVINLTFENVDDLVGTCDELVEAFNGLDYENKTGTSINLNTQDSGVLNQIVKLGKVSLNILIMN